MPPRMRACLVLAHGARRGIVTLCFQFPYTGGFARRSAVGINRKGSCLKCRRLLTKRHGARILALLSWHSTQRRSERSCIAGGVGFLIGTLLTRRRRGDTNAR